MLKNGLICLVGLVFMCLFVITRTEKRIVPLNQMKNQYNILSVSVQKPLIKLGALMPQMGENPKMFALVKDALEMASTDLKHKNLKYRYQLNIEHMSTNTDKTSVIAVRQFTRDKADAFIGFDIQTQKIIKPLLNKENIPYFSLPVAGFDKRAERTLLQNAHPQIVAHTILKLLHKKGCRRIVFISQNTIKNTELAEQLMHEAVNQKIILKKLEINKGAKEVATAFQKAQDFQPEGYIILLETPEWVDFSRHYFKAQNRLPVVHANVSDGSHITDFEGMYFPDMPGLKQSFAQRLKAFVKTAGDEKIMAAVYDSVMLSVQAFEKTDNKANIATEMQNIKHYVGVSGKFAKDDSGNYTPVPVIKKIINAKAYLIENE